MSHYRMNNPEDLVECPYDKVHMVRQKRFQYHLMKCRKNYLGNDYAVCPFNARHEMPRPEMRYHIAHCQDKAMVEQDIVYNLSQNNEEGTYFRGDTSVPRYSKDCEWEPAVKSEDWDSECANRSKNLYNPRETLQPILKDLNLRAEKQVTLRRPSTESQFSKYMKKPKDLHKNEEDYKKQMLQQILAVHRGQQKTERTESVTTLPQDHASVLQALARGRGIGRGTPLETVVGQLREPLTLIGAAGRGSPTAIGMIGRTRQSLIAQCASGGRTDESYSTDSLSTITETDATSTVSGSSVNGDTDFTLDGVSTIDDTDGMSTVNGDLDDTSTLDGQSLADGEADK